MGLFEGTFPHMLETTTTTKKAKKQNSVIFLL